MTTSIPFASEIAAAAARHHVDSRLLAAVAAQETGGPGALGGRNIIGDGGHGHGLFQIDDRYHAFARTARAMNPGANADYAAGMIAALLRRYGGDVRKALSAYNAGDPDARGTVTRWGDGVRLGYADSVLRHYAMLGENEQPEPGALASFAASQFPQLPALPPAAASSSHAAKAQTPEPDFASIVLSSGDGA
jgi:hypothetical protein